MEKDQNAFENMCKLKRSHPVDIEFQDLSYAIKGGDGKRILKSISGKFCSGELTGILGASGAGKSTLLNILAGYLTNGVTGNIMINGRPRKMKVFHKMSAYIMQENLLQPHLSVQELMMIAAKLKLGDHISLAVKRTTVAEVLNVLGLSSCTDTRTERLSGGQKKRLSVALEMVSNPPVIFLDEPTSGLDTVSMRQCVEVLRTLTGQGRTIICTIHQPSNAILQKFDQVYFIEDGTCVYNGSTSNIIPFLSSSGFECPITYSPADYLIELVQTVQESTPVLVDSIQNGKFNRKTSKTVQNLDSKFSISRTTSSIYVETTASKETKMDVNFPVSFWTQFSVIFFRMMLQMRRNTMSLWIQLMHHIACGVLFGILFYGIGNNGSFTFTNFQFCVSVILFFVYTYLMSPVLLFPEEVQLVKREYFNRWYGLKPYFLALTLRNVPIMFVLGMAFITITYFLTNQPLEISRFILFSIVSILVAQATEGLGITIGSICNVTNGSVIAPAVIAPLVFFCIYGLGYGNSIGPIMKLIMYTSYLRWGVVAVSLSIFANRAPLDCNDEIFCYYQDPKHLLRDIGMLNTSYGVHILGLLFYVILFRITAFLALRYRLTSNLSRVITNYVAKIFRHR